MLSIIIPTLNEEKYLPLLLESIKKQDFFDYELIVADAGSSDRTVEIAKKYNCRVVPGGLLPRGRNEGARVSKGEILLFLDADLVLVQPDFLRNALNKFKKRNLGAAGFPLSLVGGKKIDKTAFYIWNKLAELTQNFLPHAAGAIMVKKSIHQSVGEFDEDIIFVEDHPYVRAAGKISKFGFIKDKTVFTSSRRFEKDGRLNVYAKYVLAGLYLIFCGPVRSNIFNYKFNHYNKDENQN